MLDIRGENVFIMTTCTISKSDIYDTRVMAIVYDSGNLNIAVVISLKTQNLGRTSALNFVKIHFDVCHYNDNLIFKARMKL